VTEKQSVRDLPFNAHCRHPLLCYSPLRILTIPKTSLRCFIHHLDDEAAARVSETVLLATGALAHIGSDALLALVEAARELDS